jgi:hypothetical protein
LPGAPNHPYPQWMSYLTNWSLTLLGVAGLLGAAITVRASCCCWQCRSCDPTPQPPLWDALSISHLLVAEVAVSTALFVTLFYWAGVVGLGGSGGGFDPGDATTYLAHAGNAAVAALQVSLSRLAVASPHFLALLWFASAYMIFAWAYASATGDWRYGLDWQRAGPAVAYALAPAFCFFVFWGAFGLASAREAIGRRAAAAVAGRRRRRQQLLGRQEEGGRVAGLRAACGWWR